MARINGDGGDNSIHGTTGGDVISGNGGDDFLYGGRGADTLYGGAGRDVLYGGAGNDVLQGGPGNDFYIGGDGNDRFVFTDVPRGSGYAVEYVDDFWFNDVLDFSRIDADWTRPGNQSFIWRGEGGHFTGQAGEMIARFLGEEGQGNQQTALYMDVNGDKQTDMVVVLDGFWYGLSQEKDYWVL